MRCPFSQSRVSSLVHPNWDVTTFRLVGWKMHKLYLCSEFFLWLNCLPLCFSLMFYCCGYDFPSLKSYRKYEQQQKIYLGSSESRNSQTFTRRKITIIIKRYFYTYIYSHLQLLCNPLHCSLTSTCIITTCWSWTSIENYAAWVQLLTKVATRGYFTSEHSGVDPAIHFPSKSVN